MNSETSNLFVWVWLPGKSEPVPAGVLVQAGDSMRFAYGTQYLKRPDAISLSPTLPLSDQTFEPTGDMALPSAIRDAAPDAWGRRVILNRLTGGRGDNAETADLPERTYLIESESDRIGALDFQRSPAEYVA
ncbi:HipA N-terminal domain-containing protein [Lysinibacter cavernae]|uniref:HipA N-terminal domain-containing protein n=1 Tax=Lysinibacter cavernae TaxID=1640652 RepID=UPI003618CEC0